MISCEFAIFPSHFSNLEYVILNNNNAYIKYKIRSRSGSVWIGVLIKQYSTPDTSHIKIWVSF